MIPLNRQILIKPSEKKEEKQQGFYLPDDVVVKKKPHEVVKIVKISADSKFDGVLSAGDLIVVETHMITEIDLEKGKYHLISENNVLAKC